MKARLTSLFLLLLLFPMVCALAAPITVKGTVTDATGEPLLGVSVIVKGTTQGTTTNLDGEFTIKAEEGQVIRFTYIGYAPVEETVTGSAMAVTMHEEANALDEVVVTALGIKREQKALSRHSPPIRTPTSSIRSQARWPA